MTTLTVFDVFQSTGVPKHTRIEINSQKLIFESFKNSAGEHLLIHGPSKTGKSTLWVSEIGDEKVIKIPCNKHMEIQGLYRDIIDELDIY